MTDSDSDKIKPAQLDLASRPAPVDSHRAGGAAPPSGTQDGSTLEAYQKRNSRILAAIFLLLLLLAAAVVFVLPDLVSTPTTGAGTAESSGPGTVPGPSSTGFNPISPYAEAQRMEQRQEAQDVLAELLELQDSLESRAVQSWAEEAFGAAVEQARRGDEAYRSQQFIEAAAAYREGLARLQEIDAHSRTVFEDLLEQGSRALRDGDATLAMDAFTLALAIDGESSPARAGLERARSLDQVLGLLEQGRDLQAAGKLEQAHALYQQALAVDGEHGGARSALKEVSAAIIERDFSDLMSRGYADLQAAQPTRAEQLFRQALALKPGSPDAQAALEQAAGQITSAAITQHLGQAREHAEAERWAQALEAYEKALAVDPNLVRADEGRKHAQTRLTLDTYLVQTLDAPLRLAADSVYQQARQVFDQASGIASPGPRLAGQLQALQDLLQKARQPVPVSLQSDGHTEVTIYRVAPLGTFTRHTLPLTPGTYTAVGIREGYRDVREEFVVAFDGQPPLVTVVCDEAIF